MSPYPICREGCKIHKGFMNHYKSLENSMIKNVVELNKEYSSASVLFFGYSLGGAIATLALPKIEVILPHDVNITLINFKAPKVENYVFAYWLNSLRSTAVKIVNKGDIVTRIPPFKYYIHS